MSNPNPRMTLDPAAQQALSHVTMPYIQALCRAFPVLEGQIMAGSKITITTDAGTHLEVRIGPPKLNSMGGLPFPPMGGLIIK